jgi:hypothetical protein
MATSEYIPGDKFGERFLTSQELRRYAYDLKLTETSFSDSLLPFLEQERLLVPICRVRYPAEIIRRWWQADNPSLVDPSLPVEMNDARVEAARELYRKIQDWPRYGLVSATLQSHPLDTIDAAHEEFIERHITATPFQPWETFTVTAGQENGHPISENAVTSYYHYWQVFLLAEVLRMGVSVLLDLRDEDVCQKLYEGKLADIAPERQRGIIHLATVRTIQEFPQYQSAFDALAFYYAYRDYAAQVIIRGQKGPSYHVTADQQQNMLRAHDRSLALEACERWRVNRQAILNFLKWQCGRWQEWDQRDQQRLTDAYKRNIARTTRWYMVLTGKIDDQVITEVGDVLGRGRPTLEVIVPSWVKVQKETAARSLKHWIKPSMTPLAPVGYDVSDADCQAFLYWIETIRFFEVFLHFERLEEISNQEDIISLAVLTRETEGMGTTIEHLLNYIIGQCDPTYNLYKADRTLFPKVKWLWSDKPDIVIDGLGPHSSLTRITSDLQASLDNIVKVSAGGVYVNIMQDLLKAILIRNQGAHISLLGFARDDLVKLLEVLLRSIVLTWKHAKMRGFIHM